MLRCGFCGLRRHLFMKSSGRFSGGAEAVSDRGSLSDRFQDDEVKEPSFPSPRTEGSKDQDRTRWPHCLRSEGSDGKAFVKESDSEADLPYEPPAIAAGIKNYITHKAIAKCRMSCISYCE